MSTSVADVHAAIHVIVQEWKRDRPERQTRRSLDRADFDRLRDSGLLTLVAPPESGGLWTGLASAIRPVCEIYRELASGDPSVALVSAMHPAVISYWLATCDASQPDWEAQRQAAFASAASGEQWGTITSEPGSGGDITRTRAIATSLDGELFLPGAAYAVTGDKHFGSGSGIVDRMMTTAVPSDESEPTIFVLDVHDKPWDGSAGLQLTAEWDGMGMAATQSHAMRLEKAPAVRMAWRGSIEQVTRAAVPFVATLFTAVVLGVLDEAMAFGRQQVSKRVDELRAFERVEWTRAEQDHWLATQAFEGALRAVESGDPHDSLHGALRAKLAVAELVEAAMSRMTRVLGGGTYSRRSPTAHWFEDVRALGFLRPPWGLAFDQLLDLATTPT